MVKASDFESEDCRFESCVGLSIFCSFQNVFSCSYTASRLKCKLIPSGVSNVATQTTQPTLVRTLFLYCDSVHKGGTYIFISMEDETCFCHGSADVFVSSLARRNSFCSVKTEYHITTCPSSCTQLLLIWPSIVGRRQYVLVMQVIVSSAEDRIGLPESDTISTSTGVICMMYDPQGLFPLDPTLIHGIICHQLARDIVFRD
jgi:hypothetical protein